MKTSDKLYQLNANISLYCIAQKKPIQGMAAVHLNTKLGMIVTEIRKLEDELESLKQTDEFKNIKKWF